jgi:hypothetical protein
VVDVSAAVVAHGAADVFGHGVEVANQIFGALGLQVGMFLQGRVQIFYVGRVVHVMVQLHGRGVDGGFECGIVVGQWG